MADFKKMYLKAVKQLEDAEKTIDATLGDMQVLQDLKTDMMECRQECEKIFIQTATEEDLASGKK